MDVAALRVQLNAYKQKLASQDVPVAIVSSAKGPIGIDIVDAVVQALEAMERRVAALEKRPGFVTK